MPRKSKPSHIVELPLAPSREDTRKLNGSFLAGHRLTNALIGHGRATVLRIKADSVWEQARKLPKATPADRSHRALTFKTLLEKYRFTDASFQGIAIQHKNKAGFSDRLGSHLCQKIATKVFHACEQYLYGKRGLPRFKGIARGLHSLEGKNNQTGLYWKDNALHIWADWVIPVRQPNLVKDEWLASALQGTAKYCRVVRRNMHGKIRFFLQIVLDGRPPLKASLLEKLAPAGTIGGYDLGPSTLAYFTEEGAGIVALCADVVHAEKHLRRLQRKERRQALAMQTRHAKEGKLPPERQCKVGVAHQAVKRQIAGVQGLVARKRRQSVGKTCNTLLQRAQCWQEDGVSVKSLQRNYGRSVSRRNPGMHRTELTRKAESAGGKVSVIAVQKLKTSQYDHSVDSFEKKALSERWHVFKDGRGKVQRDVYSAFLHCYAVGEVHAPAILEEAWSRAVGSGSLQGWYYPVVRGACICATCPATGKSSHELGLAGGVLPAGSGRISSGFSGMAGQKSHGESDLALGRVTASQAGILAEEETPC